jgi:hypothetical protein
VCVCERKIQVLSTATRMIQPSHCEGAKFNVCVEGLAHLIIS